MSLWEARRMNAPIDTHKTCSDCGKAKPATTEFFRHREDRLKPGLRAQCRVCNNIAARKSKEARKAAKANGDERELTKRCTACLMYKPATPAFFEPQKGNVPLASRCRECRRGLKTLHKHAVYSAIATDPPHV